MVQIQHTTGQYQREKTFCSVRFWNLRRIVTKNNQWTSPSRLTEHYMLILCTAGSLSVSIGQHINPLRENELLTISGGQSISLWPIDSQGCDFYLLEFDCSDFFFYTLKNGFRLTTMLPDIEEQFSALYQTMQTTGQLSYPCDARVLLLLYEISRRTQIDSSKQHLFNDICNYLRQNAHQEITAQSLGLALHYHPDHLNRIVKECEGITLHQLLIREKLAKSKNLLLSTDYTIAKIADILYFPTSNGFIKFFKYHVGVGPSTYRQRKLR